MNKEIMLLFRFSLFLVIFANNVLETVLLTMAGAVHDTTKDVLRALLTTYVHCPTEQLVIAIWLKMNNILFNGQSVKTYLYDGTAPSFCSFFF